MATVVFSSPTTNFHVPFEQVMFVGMRRVIAVGYHSSFDSVTSNFFLPNSFVDVYPNKNVTCDVDIS